MTVSLHQFKLLNLDRQVAHIYQNAIHLDLFGESANTHSAVYALYDFYVEIHFKRRGEEILRIRCFKSIKKLQPYLEQVNIDEIMPLLSF